MIYVFDGYSFLSFDRGQILEFWSSVAQGWRILIDVASSDINMGNEGDCLNHPRPKGQGDLDWSFQ
jgi:hypothetical protein